MSTLADELLNDFEDSGSDGEADRRDGFLQDEPSSPPPSAANQSSALNGSTEGMILDVDEEEDDDEDEDMDVGNVGSRVSDSMEPAEDEEEAKAKVEKMHLGGVSDVRNVAGLMKTLEPVLEVGYPLLSLVPDLCEAQGLHLLRT